MIADQLPESGQVRVGKLQAPNGDAAHTDAVKVRAKELLRLGLCDLDEAQRPRLPARLAGPAQGDVLHLNPRRERRLMLERTAQRQADPERMKRLTRGMLSVSSRSTHICVAQLTSASSLEPPKQ